MTIFSIWLISVIGTLMVARQRNLGVVEYLVLSVFLGPIALAVALFSRSQRKSGSIKGKFSIDDAKYQVQDLKDELFLLTAKAKALEEQVSDLEKQATVQEGGASLDKPDDQTQTLLKQAEVPPPASQVSEEESFEFVFGKYWLNRIGVVLFVLGIGYFISYSFQYMGAVTKIGVGYVLSTLFFYWGHKLEKSEKYKKLAVGILGGAWGLAYLTTYAMHFIEATRLIASEPVAIILLAALSAAAIYSNLRYDAWGVTAVTYLLAFITVFVGKLNYGVVGYFTLIVMSIAYLSFKKNWFNLLISGIVAGFLTTVVCNEASIVYGPTWTTAMKNIFRFEIIFTMMSIVWLINAVILSFMKDDNADSRMLSVTAQLLNGAFFTYLGLGQIHMVRNALWLSLNKPFWFVFILAAAYFLFSIVYRQIKRPQYIVLNVALGFALLALAAYFKAPRLGLSFWWAIETAVLFTIGYYYREEIYRLIAGLLSVLLIFRLFIVDLGSLKVYLVAGFPLSHNIILFTIVALGLYRIALIARNTDVKGELVKEEFQFYWTVYPVVASIMMVFLLGEEVASRWLSFSWTALGVAVLAAGFLLKDKVLRSCALGILALTCLRVLFIDMIKVNTIYKIIAFLILGAVMLGISMVYTRVKVKNK